MASVITLAQALRLGYSSDKRKRRRQHRINARYLSTFHGDTCREVGSWHKNQARYGSGTGGVEDWKFANSRQGYSPYVILKLEPQAAQDTYAPYTDLMKEVKTGFGRTMSHLPAVFGVSRQTLYNWLNGETPKEQHQGKLVQLAAAARVFTGSGFKPTALSLERTVAQGKSFVELIGQGADGKETAERLVRIEKRGAAARDKLDVLLGDRTPSRPDVADMENKMTAIQKTEFTCNICGAKTVEGCLPKGWLVLCFENTYVERDFYDRHVCDSCVKTIVLKDSLGKPVSNVI